MNKLSKSKARVVAVDVLYDIVGSFLYAIGVHVFTAPNQIAPGGVTGLSTMINYLTDLPIGTLSLIINIPLLLLSYKFLGKHVTLKTLRSVLFFTVMLDVVVAPIPVYQGDMILVALFGGVAIGMGLGLVFMRGSTTGGSDIAARLLQLKHPHMPMGRAMFWIDCAILVSSSFVFKQLEAALYGLITIFACTKMIDSVLYGLDTGKMVLVVSEKSAEVAKAILNDLDRGATLLSAKGAYSGSDKYVLLTAVRKTQFHQLKNIISEVDPSAFIIVTEAGEIMGEGFKPIQDEKKK